MPAPARTARWGAAAAASSINDLAYFERAVAHLLAGWLPKLADMALKVELGEQLFRALDRASQLRARLSGLTRATAAELPVQQGWQRLMRHVDTAPDAATMLASLHQVLWPRVVSLHEAHLTSTDPMGDSGSHRLLARSLPDLAADHAWSQTVLPSGPAAPPREAFLAEVEALWNARREGPELASGDALWQPVDRVPAATRPDGLVLCAQGSLGVLTRDSVGDPEDVARFLHADLDEEYTTLELVARNSYEHPDLPWSFHLDMARQVADEARHARLMRRLLVERGFDYGAFPVSTGSYDGLYQFEPCAPGSRKELLWRMLIRQTFMEGLALDSLAHDLDRRARAGQDDIVETLDYILRDEVFHVQSGMRWCSFLLGDDRRALLQARYEALTHMATEAEAMRDRFVMEHLEEAMAELVIIEEGKSRRGGKPPDRPLNRLGRQQAGMSDEDILQVLSWGYATEAPRS